MTKSGPGVDAKMIAIRQTPGDEAAILFIHGFGGGVGGTWGQFPSFLAQADALKRWDIYDLGYTTSLAPDIRGIWSAKAGLEILSNYFRTRVNFGPLASYRSLALIAHSMGGLVIQRALLDDAHLTARVGHVFLFGTPSRGLSKAGFFSFLQRSIRDMDDDSEFITDLRNRWEKAFRDPVQRHFGFWTIAGDRDEFVPATSSLEAFAEEDRCVVLGNHIQIVKPQNPESLSVQVVLRGLVGEAAPGGPWNSARVAVETRDFYRAVAILQPHVDELDDQHLVQLALALESIGSKEEALRLLWSRPQLGLDASGVLAGRLKRRWGAEGRQADADEALHLYADAYQRAVAADDHYQALYQGINVAFMQAVYKGDREAARATAHEVLDHCAQAPKDLWCVATVGEAQLHLGDTDAALWAYSEALKMIRSARDVQSMYTQGATLARELRNEKAEESLAQMFREGFDE